MRHKRNLLSQITRATQGRAPGPEMPLAPPKPAKKQIALRVPIPVWRAFRRIAYEEERTIQSILMEGAEWVLRKHGLPTADEITRECRERQ